MDQAAVVQHAAETDDGGSGIGKADIGKLFQRRAPRGRIKQSADFDPQRGRHGSNNLVDRIQR